MIAVLYNDTIDLVDSGAIETVKTIRRHCDEAKDSISDTTHKLYRSLHESDNATMGVLYVYLNLLQETQEMVSSLRKYLRAYAKMCDNNFSGRPRLTT